MRVTCTNCGGAHTPWDCKRPAKKSTVRKNVPAIDGVSVAERVEPGDSASSAKRPVDTNSAEADNEPHEAYVSGDDMPTVKLQSSSALSIISPNVVSAFPPKRPRGRPKSITDMRTYKAAKQREYRAKWKGRE